MRRRFAPWYWAAGVCAVTLVGALLRFYRLDVQSIWLDEYPNVIHLTAPRLRDYLLLMQLYLPEQAQAPLYYILVYGWAHIAGMAVPVLRTLSVLLGLTAIPLIYLLGAHLFNRRAGLLAALCLAMSPQHIWHAQEIRPYPLITPLAILSIYAFLRLLRNGGPRWWALHFIANALLVTTQLLTVLVPVVEGLFLLCFIKRRFRKALLWGAVHAIFLLPWAIAILTMPAAYTSEHKDAFFQFERVFGDLCCDDVVAIHTDLLPAWKTNPPEASPKAVQRLLHFRPAMDTLLIGLTLACSLWFLLRLIRPKAGTAGYSTQPNSAADAASLSEFRENGLLLFLLAIVPVAVLAAATWLTKRPLQAPMYSLYNTIALYLFIGVALSQLRSSALFGTAAAMLIIAYGYQLAIFLPGVTRANWQLAASLVTREGTPRDAIVEFEYGWPAHYMAYYMSGTGMPSKRVASPEGAVTEAARHLAHGEPGSRHAWLLCERVFIDWLWPGFNLDETMEEAFAARHMDFERYDLSGHYNIIVWQLTARPGGVVPGPPVPALDGTDFKALREELGVSAQTGSSNEAIEERLRQRVPFWPPINKFFMLVHAMDALDAGDMPVAEALVRRVVEQYPAYSLGRFAMGLLHTRQGRLDAAQEEFAEAFRLQSSLQPLLGAYAQSLGPNPDPQAAQAEIDRLEEMNFIFTSVLESARAARFGSTPSHGVQ